MKCITRDEIGLKKPRRSLLTMAGKPQGVFLHCSDGKRSADIDRSKMICRQMQAWHFSQGWKDVGYSFAVDDAGNVFELRGWGKRGSHAGSPYNGTHHSVVVMGDGKQTTPAMEAALAQVLDEHERLYGTKDHRGHREVSSKECPGDAAYAWLVARRGQ